MQIHVRAHQDINTPELRSMLEARTRRVLGRLSQGLSEVTVVAAREPPDKGARIICRVSGVLDEVGSLHVSHKGRDPKVAIDTALDGFRRATLRNLARRQAQSPRNLANIFDAPTLDLAG